MDGCACVWGGGCPYTRSQKLSGGGGRGGRVRGHIRKSPPRQCSTSVVHTLPHPIQSVALPPPAAPLGNRYYGDTYQAPHAQPGDERETAARWLLHVCVGLWLQFHPHLPATFHLLHPPSMMSRAEKWLEGCPARKLCILTGAGVIVRHRVGMSRRAASDRNG